MLRNTRQKTNVNPLSFHVLLIIVNDCSRPYIVNKRRYEWHWHHTKWSTIDRSRILKMKTTSILLLNAEVLQWSTIGDILRHRRLSPFGHVARLDHRRITTNAKSQWLAGEDRRAALANVWLSSVHEDADAIPLSCRCYMKIWDCHGSQSGAMAQWWLGLRDGDDDFSAPDTVTDS